MASNITGDGLPEAESTSGEKEGPKPSTRGRSTTASETTKRSSLLKPKEGGSGYDFSGSYEQTRRVRFKFGAHSLAVEATLAKLFESLTVECSGVLVQPQWKHFRHLDMLKNDQIRLSNGIWRSWHIKYQKGREPLFCTFNLNTKLNDHTRPEAVVLEGKYQKRKVEAVAKEYRKWRLFHREKFRLRGYKVDPLLADLLEKAHGDELGDGNSAELQAMQVEPSLSGFIQLDELNDPFFMGLGQEYYTDYSSNSNVMFQPKMDVLSSALDEFLGKLEPMEVLLSRTSSANYQSPLATFPPLTASSPFTPPTPPTPHSLPSHHHTGQLQQHQQQPQQQQQQQQQIMSSQITPTLSPLASRHIPPPSTMELSSLANFMVSESSNSMFPPFSSPPQTYLQQQTHNIYDDSHDVTPIHTPPPQPPPETQFSLPPEASSAMFQFPLKRDPSSESLPSPHGEYLSPSAGGPSPGNIQLTTPDYNSPSIMRSQSNYSNMSSGQQPMSGNVTMDTQHHSTILTQQAIDRSLGNMAALYDSSLSSVAGPGGVATMEGAGTSGGILGSKRKEGSGQFLPGSKRRSPFNSQTDLPLWAEDDNSPAMPPPPAPLSARRASIGSAIQLSERPILQKSGSEPSGSLVLKEHIKLLSQQHDVHSQELDKQQTLARQQYHDVLQQYKMQIVGQEQLNESDKQLLRTVLSKPALVDILRTLLLSPSSVSTSPSFTQPAPSPLLHTPSPTPSSSIHHKLTKFSSGSEREGLPSPEAEVTEFQSRILVAAAVQASGGGSDGNGGTQSPSNNNHISLSSTPEPTLASMSFTTTSSLMSDQPDQLSPVSGDSKYQLGIQGGGGGVFDSSAAAKLKLKTSRGLSSEQKEVYREIRRQSHISAEQRRRGTIKQGFDQLQSLVIDPSSYPSGKVSKATVLERTVEYIEHAHHERENRERQMQALRREQEELNTAITRCQENLPASGVPVTRQRFEENRKRFQEYVQKRTLQNYKFWIYSIILQQLFETYNRTVSTGNQDELCRTVLAWFEQNCSLHALRPVVMNSLKELSTKTSILSEPSQVPQQLVQYAKQQLKASKDLNS